MNLRKVWGSLWSRSNSCKDSTKAIQLPIDILVQILMLMEPRDAVKLRCVDDD
ncbi:hypothetical protein HID58_087963 [Brassica napus]|uniref:F-box domain-containing protein n=1 Tax=Brassica napus TaxID=3708 RepID=A0ABQ7XUV3_BRANA|nr:hypothetical protein HID58_087963 [Brassica napus]